MENLTSTATQEKSWPENWMPKPWATALHRKFSMLYLQKFTSCFQDQETIDEWCECWAEALAGLEGAQIKAGLEYSRDHHIWPPTCAEFRAACKARPKAMIALPPPKTDKEIGKRRVAEILSTLAGNKPVSGRAYWKKVLETKGLPESTYEFGRKALHNLENPLAQQL
jgi:hypothetical protein